jgi:hypothetical protein
MTGITALGGLAATKALTKLIGKKWPRVADALAANLGAEQLSLAANNMDLPGRPSSFDAYARSMVRSGIEESRRKHSR